MRRTSLSILLALSPIVIACGGGGGADAGPIDAGLDAPEIPDAPMVDAGPIDAGMPPDAPGTASLVGVITRSADGTGISPMGDGRGDVYLYLFDDDPADTTRMPNLIAEFVARGADLSTPERSIPYALYGIPPRPEPYHVAIFLDDDGNAMPADPRPTIGDSVATRAGGTPQVVVPDPVAQSHDIDLNFVLFFTP